MGILNIPEAEFLIDSIFKILDKSGSNQVFILQKIKFDDFLKYQKIFMFGNAMDKAKISFKILDENQ